MTKSSITIWIFLLITVLVIAFFWVNRPLRVTIETSLPPNFPQQGFSHDYFEALLQIYVTADGRVNYERWQQHPGSIAQLESYLTAVSRFSPDSSPKRFSSRNEKLAYWMYAYNAYVINSVLDHWPIGSVTDVKAPIEAVTGLGFFHQQRFSFGGEFLSLRTVENDKIRKGYTDPRIHFVLNCASESCPIARPELPVGDDLEALMDRATSEFINELANVSVDHANATIYLSTIFKWYEKDFVDAIRLEGKPSINGLVTYISSYAQDDLASDLALASNYTIRFRDYDWGLNSSH